MVALSVRSIDRRPVACNARPLLFEAQAYLERGLYVEAGCRLREAVRRFLQAECEYHHCLPRQRRKPTPHSLAIALSKAGCLDDACRQWILEAIALGNKASHLAFVRPSAMEAAIVLMHSFLDGSPYLTEPKAGGRS